MALSNISKEHLNNLLEITNLNDLNNEKIIQSIQRNSNNYGKLKTLFRQLQFIKNEINEVLQESIVSNELEKIKCNFKKRPGNNYYLYLNKKNKRFFSMLSPKEWDKYDDYLGEYLYDYDLTFNKINQSSLS